MAEGDFLRRQWNTLPAQGQTGVFFLGGGGFFISKEVVFGLEMSVL